MCPGMREGRAQHLFYSQARGAEQNSQERRSSREQSALGCLLLPGMRAAGVPVPEGRRPGEEGSPGQASVPPGTTWSEGGVAKCWGKWERGSWSPSAEAAQPSVTIRSPQAAQRLLPAPSRPSSRITQLPAL